MRWMLALFCLTFATLSSAALVVTVDGKPVPGIPGQPLNASSSHFVEKVLVLKSARQLQLIRDGKPFKTYRISLGKKPIGPKLEEGDKKTPEGLYWLDWRKTSERFNLSMHISYPNITDSARARREGVRPGSMLMIHGTPDTEENPEQLFHTLDWTDGCIGMRNVDMREVWTLVKDGTLIEIRP